MVHENNGVVAITIPFLKLIHVFSAFAETESNQSTGLATTFHTPKHEGEKCCAYEEHVGSRKRHARFYSSCVLLLLRKYGEG